MSSAVIHIAVVELSCCRSIKTMPASEAV